LFLKIIIKKESINMSEYKSNSHKAREEEKQQVEIIEKKKIQPVAKGKTKKKSEVKKFADIFVAEDVTSVKNYIINDVLIPAAKKAISDIVTNGIDMLLYGEAKGRSRDRDRSSSRVSYTKYYERGRESERDYDRRTTRRSVYDYDDIILDTRGEAEEVLNRMDDLIDAYGMVSVADLYDLVGISGNYTDNKYGWTNLRNATVQRVRDGYLLKLPKALPFD
jgi:hypothetical protein